MIISRGGFQTISSSGGKKIVVPASQELWYVTFELIRIGFAPQSRTTTEEPIRSQPKPEQQPHKQVLIVNENFEQVGFTPGGLRTNVLPGTESHCYQTRPPKFDAHQSEGLAWLQSC